MSFLLGYDVGSSSVKGAIIEVETGRCVASASSPTENELEISAPKLGWAEQDPRVWWEHVVKVTQLLKRKNPVACAGIEAIGISYQMHGLVVLDDHGQVIRPSIIWCDSRAVPVGEKAFKDLGESRCLAELHNSPGNFTASKLAWVKQNEPESYARVKHACLPGDYIAFLLTGKICTTESGLSEGILWNFKENSTARFLLEYYGIDPEIFPEPLPSFAVHGVLSDKAASELGLTAGIAVSYRAGDQPNNALSLNVFEPGECATTAGTSGVVYSVSGEIAPDKASRVNTFVHVNHTAKAPRYGTLLCINGTGILYSWLRREFAGSTRYDVLNTEAQSIEAGSEGVSIFPFGNGAERSLGNKELGAAFEGISFPRHRRAHILRAACEGIVYSLRYGMEVMEQMKIPLKTVRAGKANLFLSPLFREIFCQVTGAKLELFDTDGAQGAARGAGIGCGVYKNPTEAFKSLALLDTTTPDSAGVAHYRSLYTQWRGTLEDKLAKG